MIETNKNFSFLKGRGALASLCLVVCCALGIILDQISKHHAHSVLLHWEEEENVDNFIGRRQHVFTIGQIEEEKPHFTLAWQYSRNKGAAFSFLNDLDDRYRVPFFYGVTILAVFLIAFYLYTTPPDHLFTRFGLVMILSGALGNGLDRLQHGYVIDFIDTKWRIWGWSHDFAIFNIADVCINIGVIAMLIDLFILRKKPEKPVKA